MNLLNTKLIPATEDVWWQPLPDGWPALQPARVLVLAAAAGSGEATAARIGKMLAACRLAAGDYQLLQVEDGQRTAWHRLREAVAPQLVLLLGIDPLQLGISARLAPNQLHGFDGRSWIVSAAPDAFFADDNLRGHVWNHCLKPFFGL